VSAIASALLESLTRLLPAGESGNASPATETATETADSTALRQVITALALALERGELALDLEAPAPEGIGPDAAATGEAAATAEAAASLGWPAAHLEALQACGWLLDAQDQHEPWAEAPVVRDGRWLRWRRWHEQLQRCRQSLISLGQAPLPGSADPAQGIEARR
jgi:hypothetical protein